MARRKWNQMKIWIPANLNLNWIFSLSKSPKAIGGGKKPKESRVWALSGTNKDAVTLDYTKDKDDGDSAPLPQAVYLPDADVRLKKAFDYFFSSKTICVLGGRDTAR